MKKILYVFFLFIISTPILAHVEHYKKIKNLNFDIYRNNELVGIHNYDFIRDGDNLKVKSIINFEIKKLGIVLYKYYASGIEIYQKNKFVGFESHTKQNKKEKFCNIFLKEGQFFIEGSSYKGPVPKDFIVGTWWNHSIVKKKSQISAISGRVIYQSVKFIGKDEIIVGGKSFTALHFNFSSTDANLKKNKKLNTDVWYDEKTLHWVKASFEKQGYWEYRLSDMIFYK